MSNMRLDALRLAIREGEMRLQLPREKYKDMIRLAVSNARIRLARIESGQDEGGMIWNDDRQCWQYEHEQADQLAVVAQPSGRGRTITEG